MAEEITPDTPQEPRKFKDRKEYLEFITEQKALKAKEAEQKNESRFETFNADEHVASKKEPKQPKELTDSLRSILTAVNNNNKISNQILEKLNQKIAKESTSSNSENVRKSSKQESVGSIPDNSDNSRQLSDKIEALKITVINLGKTAEAIRSAILERPISDNQPQQNIINVRPRDEQESITKIIENRPQYITNVRQYQYKRNPTYRRNRSDGLISGLGRKIGTHIGGRGLGNIIARSIKLGERATGGIIKAPLKIAAKAVKAPLKIAARSVSSAVGRNTRNDLMRSNRANETSKFRKKMLELLGIISKKDTQQATTTQTSSSKGMSPLAMAASIGAAVLGIKALVDNMSKETKDKINKYLYDVQEKLKDSALKGAYDFQEYIKKWLYDNNPLKEFGEKLGSTIYDWVSTLNGFGEKLGSKLFDIVNGVEKAFTSAKEGGEKLAGKVADKALEVSTDVYKTVTNAPENLTKMVKDSGPGEAIQIAINRHVAQNKMPDYVSGMKTNNIQPNKEYNSIASSLSKPNALPTLKQLEAQQKQSNDLQRERDKQALQPIIVNSTNNTKESPKQPSIVRLGTRNTDSSKQMLDRSILTGGYIGTGFLVN